MSRVPPSGSAVGMHRTLAYANWNEFRKKTWVIPWQKSENEQCKNVGCHDVF